MKLQVITAFGLVSLLAVGESTSALAQNYKVLYNFDFGSGSQPVAGLVRDAEGNLYGTTPSGGLRWGTVFKLNKSGQATALYRFAGGADGANPYGGLLRDSAGNLYGTTANGGQGFGTVFKVDPNGHETVLYTFSGGADGANPYDGLVRDAAGNFYGTTLYGGEGTLCYPLSTLGCGTIFKIDRVGKETVLYSFSGGADGAMPYAGLIRDGAGNLYGTTQRGGDMSCDTYGCGTVFKLNAKGIETVLHEFTGAPDGMLPYGGVALDSGHNLYGTTEFGGSVTYNSGVVFKLDRNGTETLLYTFGVADGTPTATVVLDSVGNLYGTTEAAGSSCFEGCGTVFEIDSAGVLTFLHLFSGPPDGEYPAAPLLLDAAGNLYGTTSAGGSSGTGSGTVFGLKP